MSVCESLLQVLEDGEVPELDKRRARKAIALLSRVMGEGLVVEMISMPSAETFIVPGTQDRYVVYETYGDGTYDIIKCGGMFPEDALIGWTPGQSPSAYFKELDEQYNEEKKLPGKSHCSPTWRARNQNTGPKRKIVRPEIRTNAPKLAADHQG